MPTWLQLVGATQDSILVKWKLPNGMTNSQLATYQNNNGWDIRVCKWGDDCPGGGDKISGSDQT